MSPAFLPRVLPKTFIATLTLTGLLVGAAGCDGGLNFSRDKLAAKARKTFEEKVQPLLLDTCAACHSGNDDLGFVRPNPDLYTATLTWPGLVNLADPVGSRLLAKGGHDGPAWTNDQTRTIRNWISLEAELRAVEPLKPLSTVAKQVVDGVNTIDLKDVGLTGSSITFTADLLDNGIYITDIQVQAGPQGVRLVHPLWVAWKNNVPFPDNGDTFADVSVELLGGESGPMGGGSFPFVPIAPDSYISLTFQKAEVFSEIAQPDAAVIDGGPIVGGCGALPAFAASAKGPIANTCGGCHSGGNAASAMNLMTVTSDDAGEYGRACVEVKNRVNLTTPAQSAIFNATRPGQNGHPFTFDQAAFNTFESAVTQWITAEAAAQ